MKILIIIFVSLFFISCTSKNVSYLKKEKRSMHEKNTVEVYIDAFGSIYPNDLVSDKSLISGSLMNTFYNGCNCNINDVNSESELLKNLNWEKSQNIIWKNRSLEIYNKSKKLSTNDLFFLVHGFNNDIESSFLNYYLVKKNLTSYYKKLHKKVPIIIEVYWDGFNALSKGELVNAWKNAQSSGPLVRFNLRKLLNNLMMLNSEFNVNFITHSSGSFVVASTLGYPCSALPLLYKKTNDDDYNEFKKYGDGEGSNKLYSIPEFQNIKIAMIAAASPTTILTGGDRKECSNVKDGLLSKNTSIYLTIKKNDKVLKKPLSLSSKFGATGLGQDKKLFIEEFNINTKLNFKIYDFDFTDSRNVAYSESHSLKEYLSHKNFDSYVKAFLGFK